MTEIGRLYAEGRQLKAKAMKIRNEAEKANADLSRSWNEVKKLHIEASQLEDEAYRLSGEAEKLQRRTGGRSSERGSY